MAEVQRMIDSGLLKAMLDIFDEYYLRVLTSERKPTADEETVLLSVADLLI